MTRHASRRPDPVSPPATEAVPTTTSPAPSATTASRVSWGWRFALFIWATSFLFLLLLEFLSATFRVVGSWFRG